MSNKPTADVAWEAYEKTLAPVRVTQAIVESCVKSIRDLPDHLRNAAHRTFETARECYNQALDYETKAYDQWRTVATSPTLFDGAPTAPTDSQGTVASGPAMNVVEFQPPTNARARRTGRASGPSTRGKDSTAKSSKAAKPAASAPAPPAE